MSRKSQAIGETDSRIRFNFVPTPTDLDDAMLDVYEHRVYVHLSRRAQKHGVAWPSVKSMAEKCRMSIRRLHTALNTLEARRMIERQTREGTTSYITLTDPSEWLSDATPAPDAHPGTYAPDAHPPHEPMHEVHTPYARRAYKEDKEKKMNTTIKKINTHAIEKSESRALAHAEAAPQQGLESKRSSNRFDPASVDLPACVDRQQWLDFLTHRKKKKSPVTELASARLLKKLAAHPEHANQMLDDAIMNGWTGVFAPRDSKRQTAPPEPKHRKNPKRFRVNDSVYRPDTGQNEFIDELLEPMKARMSNGEVWDLRGCERWTN